MLAKNIYRTMLWIGLLNLCLYSMAKGQSDTTFLKKQIRYSDFMRTLQKNNLAYAAEKFNINISEGAIEMAKVFPDPELSMAWFDNGQKRMNMGYGYNAAIGWTLELGGKRNARIQLAKSEAQLSRYLLQDYWNKLRADATIKYLEAMQNKRLTSILVQSYQAMAQLAKSDSVRAQLGAITPIDAKQSKLEAGNLFNEVLKGIADWKTSLSNLNLLIGTKQSDTLLMPLGSFEAFDRRFTLQTLIVSAQHNRADLIAALQSKEVSQKNWALAKANRSIDLGLTAGLSYNAYVRNAIAPTPSFTQTSIGLSIPLKFSNNKTGDLKTTYYSTLQAEAQYQQAEIQVQNEITQAYFNYQAAQQQVQQFNKGLLKEAKSIFDGKVYSYQRGESNLLEVLLAQRTYNDTQQNYVQTLFNYAATLVELERAAGIWDINF